MFDRLGSLAIRKEEASSDLWQSFATPVWFKDRKLQDVAHELARQVAYSKTLPTVAEQDAAMQVAWDQRVKLEKLAERHGEKEQFEAFRAWVEKTYRVYVMPNFYSSGFNRPSTFEKPVQRAMRVTQETVKKAAPMAKKIAKSPWTWSVLGLAVAGTVAYKMGAVDFIKSKVGTSNEDYDWE